MERYSNNTYYGYIVQGKPKEAAEYLSRFLLKRRKAKKYYEVFERGKMPVMTGIRAIDDILGAFAEYYRKVFWRGESASEGKRYLAERFAALYSLEMTELSDDKAVDEFWDDVVEKRLEAEVTAAGYNYLGGDTQGYLGPYIWKKTKTRTYNVELPEGSEKYTLYMAHSFVSRSWMAFISFNRIGTGGWAGGDGSMYCVYSSYWKRLYTSAFKVDFLKHEAQHVKDKKNYPDMTACQLEYRAKLVQLIYAKNSRAITGFVSEASSGDSTNAHAYASFLLVRRLSQRLFNSEHESDIKLWKGKRREIAACARELLADSINDMKTGKLDC